MKLIYVQTGKEVKVGDTVQGLFNKYTVEYFRPPHKPSSSGKVSTDRGEFFVSIIGAKWIDRDDR